MMGHAVRYVDADAQVRFDLHASLDAALERVEQLHNEAGVADVRVFREVPIEVRTYYRVAVVGDESTPSPTGALASLPAAVDAGCPAARSTPTGTSLPAAVDAGVGASGADVVGLVTAAAEAQVAQVAKAASEDEPAAVAVAVDVDEPSVAAVPQQLSGAVVMTPPPATAEPAEPAAPEPRRALFGRG